jgi:hypothetical protein
MEKGGNGIPRGNNRAGCRQKAKVEVKVEVKGFHPPLALTLT